MIGAATLGVLSLGRCWWTGQRGQTPKWHWGIPAVELQGCDACRGCISAASIEMWNSGFQGIHCLELQVLVFVQTLHVQLVTSLLHQHKCALWRN